MGSESRIALEGGQSAPLVASPRRAHPMSEEARRRPGPAPVVKETIEGPESARRAFPGPFCRGPAPRPRRCGRRESGRHPSLKSEESRLFYGSQ